MGKVRVRKDIKSISVVEWLGTLQGEKSGIRLEGSTVVNVGIRLDNPDKFLTWVVEVQLDLVGRGTNGFITSELQLVDQVLVRVLCHSTSFISIQEDVVNVKGSGNKGFAVIRHVLD